MSTSRDSCCLASVKKQKHDFQVFAFVQCVIKQLLDSVFVISRIIKVSVRDQPQPSASFEPLPRP